MHGSTPAAAVPSFAPCVYVLCFCSFGYPQACFDPFPLCAFFRAACVRPCSRTCSTGHAYTHLDLCPRFAFAAPPVNAADAAAPAAPVHVSTPAPAAQLPAPFKYAAAAVAPVTFMHALIPAPAPALPALTVYGSAPVALAVPMHVPYLEPTNLVAPATVPAPVIMIPAVVKAPVPAAPAALFAPAAAAPAKALVFTNERALHVKREYVALHMIYADKITTLPFHANANDTAAMKHLLKAMGASLADIFARADLDGASADIAAWVLGWATPLSEAIRLAFAANKPSAGELHALPVDYFLPSRRSFDQRQHRPLRLYFF